MSRIVRATLLAIVAALLAVVLPAGASAADTVIVKYRESASSAQRATLADRLDLGRTVGRVRRIGGQVVRVDGNARQVAARLEQSRRVAYAEPNKILHPGRAERSALRPALGSQQHRPDRRHRGRRHRRS